MEQKTGIEPAYSAWEADVLPLNYSRTSIFYHSGFVKARNSAIFTYRVSCASKQYLKFSNAKILGINDSENMITLAKKNYLNMECMLCDTENGFADIVSLMLFQILISGIGIQA